jgi:hypothetical protein
MIVDPSTIQGRANILAKASFHVARIMGANLKIDTLVHTWRLWSFVMVRQSIPQWRLASSLDPKTSPEK